MQRKPILVIECQVDDLQSARAALEKDIEHYLRNEYTVLKVGQDVRLPKDLANVQSLHVVDLVTASNDSTSQEPDLIDISLAIHLFELSRQPRSDLEVANPSIAMDVDTDDMNATERLRAHVTLVPHLEMQGLWESLIFDESLHIRLLRFLVRMIAFAGSTTSTFSRIVLLYGPPGTGKTTLCRGLVQKLAIRLRGHFRTVKLVELDAAALFSKFFGESSKLVYRVFETIERMLAQDPDIFICVFIDEVESLASARQQTIGGQEPKDSMRAVNALLMALDRLSKHSNVIVLCTSNLIQTMDSAVLDRISVKSYVPLPGIRTICEIFRRCYLDLLELQVITSLQPDTAMKEHVSESEYISVNDEDLAIQSLDAFPIWEVMQGAIEQKLPLNEESMAYKLWKIAEKSIGLSGRVLRGLPMEAIAMYTNFDPCSYEEALDALSRIVEDRHIKDE